MSEANPEDSYYDAAGIRRSAVTQLQLFMTAAEISAYKT